MRSFAQSWAILWVNCGPASTHTATKSVMNASSSRNTWMSRKRSFCRCPFTSKAFKNRVCTRTHISCRPSIRRRTLMCIRMQLCRHSLRRWLSKLLILSGSRKWLSGPDDSSCLMLKKYQVPIQAENELNLSSTSKWTNQLQHQFSDPISVSVRKSAQSPKRSEINSSTN